MFAFHIEWRAQIQIYFYYWRNIVSWCKLFWRRKIHREYIACNDITIKLCNPFDTDIEHKANVILSLISVKPMTVMGLTTYCYFKRNQCGTRLISKNATKTKITQHIPFWHVTTSVFDLDIYRQTHIIYRWSQNLKQKWNKCWLKKTIEITWKAQNGTE